MKKIKFGVIGCSSFFKKRISDAVSKSEYAEIVAIASRDLEKARRWAEELGIKYYDSYNELLERVEIDAVYIPLPIGLHKEWTIKAAKAGKHVLCEKSLSDNYEDVKEMVKVCKENRVKLYENFMVKNHTQHLEVLNIIKKGKIGKIFSFKSSFGFPPFDDGNIRYKKELGGGVLNDVGCYPVFMSRFIFNEEPISVTCNLDIDSEKGIDVSGGAFLEFSDNKIAIFDFGFRNFYQNEYSVWGSEGLIKVNRAYTISEDMVPDVDFISDRNEGRTTKIMIDAVNQYTETFDEFCLDILNDRESDFQGILNQAKVMEALRVSNRLGEKVRVSDFDNNDGDKAKIVVVSGFFDPLRISHIEYFKLSKNLGDKLIVILNNDEQIVLKKGKVFMPLEERKKIIEALRNVDEVFVSIDEDDSVCKSLEAIRPHIFAKGGNRFAHEISEAKICKNLEIVIVDCLSEKIKPSKNSKKN